jgi:transposase
MTTMTEPDRGVTIGIDTHADFHVAAALDELGRVRNTETFAASPVGNDGLLAWADQFGPISAAGIEGTGSWGASLARFMADNGVRCVEVNQPNRQHRRRHGKSDTTDAIGAARAVQAGEATATPRGHNGNAESLRLIRVAHRSAVKARTQAINQLRSIITTGPDTLTARFVPMTRNDLVGSAARLRPAAGGAGPVNAAKIAMRSLARRIETLNDEIADLETTRNDLVDRTAPDELLNELGVGPAVAADLLIAVGDNPRRLHSEAAFAALCGVSPVESSSGRQQQRHRLNRGGDRQANSALWRIVMVRLSCHQETRDYMNKCLAGNKTKKDAIRCLKRTMARRIYKILRDHPPTLHEPLDNP